MQNIKEELNAVHEKDLEKLLTHFGVFKDFSESKYKCKFCKEVVNFENLYSLLPESGTINFICNKPNCVSQLLDHLEVKKQN